jgi:hypothetical protein
MTTASQSLVTAVVAGRPLSVFDTRAGGDSSVEINVHRAGGGVQKSYGSPKKTHGDVTISRTYESERDIKELAAWLRQQLGKVASVSEQPLDEDGVAFGKPTVYAGRFKSFDPGEYDSDSDDRRVMTLGFTISEVA